MYRFKLNYSFEELFIRGLHSHETALKKLSYYIEPESDSFDSMTIRDIGIESGVTPDSFIDELFPTISRGEKELALELEIEYVTENPYLSLYEED